MPATPSNALNINTAGIVTFDGTATFSADTVTQYNAVVGGASNALTSVAPSATSGVPLISSGSAANPAFGTAVVAGGGTGVATFANTSALITTGTTATGAVQNIASVAAGQVLTSAGTSTIPAWSAAPSVTSITLSSGTALSNYTEGTWTPTLLGSSTAGTPSYTTQNGYYRRIGNIVYVSAFVNGSLSGASGSNLIGGLPFTIHNLANCPGMTILNDVLGQTYGTGNTMIFGFGLPNTTTIQVNQQGSAHSASAVAIINGTQQWNLSMVYGI
jgi:hypothetical protein